MKEKFSSIVDWLSDTEPSDPSNAGPTAEDGMSEKKRRKPIPVISAQEASSGYMKRVVRVDRLCVIAAGVARCIPADYLGRYPDTFAAMVADTSRAILAKLEEE